MRRALLESARGDETPPRIPLASGCYIVSTKLDLEWRSVQVVISTAHTTRVQLADFRHGAHVTRSDDED